MTYLYPFARGARKSQAFGANPNNGVNPVGGHTGDDWAVNVGTPIHAACDGIIRNSSWLSENYLDNPWWLTQMGGDTTVLDGMDGNGVTDSMPTFVYAHQSDSTAPVGARVRQGQIIGYSGNSGTATTGPHCHVEVLPPGWDWNNGTYGRVNPEWWFDEYPDELTIATQGAVSLPKPIKKESEMPVHKRVTGTHKPHRLPKGGVYRLSARDDGASQNFAVNGIGQYDVKLFIGGTALAAGQKLEVTFEVVSNGRASGYFKQDIHGTATGEFEGCAVFGMPVAAGTILNAAVVSSQDSAYIERFAAEVTTWKA
jgi:hypothetical protein